MSSDRPLVASGEPLKVILALGDDRPLIVVIFDHVEARQVCIFNPSQVIANFHAPRERMLGPLSVERMNNHHRKVPKSQVRFR